MRRSLLIFVFAAAVFGGAWRAHAGSATAGRDALRFPPVPSPTTSRKFDEYGNIGWRDERARLDNLAVEARNDPTAVACLICYGGRRAHEGEARRRCTRAARYLKTTGGIEASRVVTLDGGFRQELTVELWLLPAGSTPPTASPTLDPSEVTVIKDAPRRKRPKR